LTNLCVQVIKSLIMQNSPASCHILPLRYKYFSLVPCSQTPSVNVLLLEWHIKRNYITSIVTPHGNVLYFLLVILWGLHLYTF
jgi:hypothetical protein